MSNKKKRWEIEILRYELGVYPRYREQSIQHSDELLKKFSNPNYFGYKGVGELVGRTAVQVVDNKDDAIKGRNTLRAYCNAIGVTVLKRNHLEKVA